MAENNNKKPPRSAMPKFNTLSGFTRTFLLFCSFVCLSCANTGEGGPVFCRGLNRARRQHTHSRLRGGVFCEEHENAFRPHSTSAYIIPTSTTPQPSHFYWASRRTLPFSYFYTSSYGFSSIFPSLENLFLASANNKKRRRKFAPERTR